MALKQKVLTTPTFIGGALQPAGAIVSIDTNEIDVDDVEDDNGKKRSVTPNLADIGVAPVLTPTEVAAIAPTGPHPTMPQTVPPGAMQTNAGYASGEALLVAQGHPDFEEMAAGAEKLNAGVEEEAVTRLSATTQDSGTATTPTKATAKSK